MRFQVLHQQVTAPGPKHCRIESFTTRPKGSCPHASKLQPPNRNTTGLSHLALGYHPVVTRLHPLDGKHHSWSQPSSNVDHDYLLILEMQFTPSNYSEILDPWICAGIPLAEKMVMHLLASLVHSFNWKLPEGEELDLSEQFKMVLKKSTPLIAIPTERLSSLNLYA